MATATSVYGVRLRPGEKVTSLALAELVEDLSIYPRHAVDDVNVARMVQALQAGGTLPPPIVDRASKRITDGWHRSRAYRRVLGTSGVVDVVLRTYRGEGEMFLDAIACNSDHGRQLDKMDEVRCAIRADQLGISLQRVAVVLHRPEEAVRKLLVVRVAIAPAGSQGSVTGSPKIVLKRPVQHLAGKQLTAAQAAAQPSVPGTSYLLLAKQLSDALRADMANREDEHLMSALRDLRDDLVRYFANKPAA